MPDPSQTQASRSERALTVLVVDDQPLVADMVAMKLASDPCLHVDTATTVDDARDAIRRAGGYAAILLDYHMPGVSGFGALHDLGAENGGRVAIMSGETDALLVDAALAQGACGFIPKGVDSATLGRAIGVIVAGGVFLPVSHRPTTADAPQPEKRSRRKRLISEMLIARMTVEEIAENLGVDQAVVHFEIGQIRKGAGA